MYKLLVYISIFVVSGKIHSMKVGIKQDLRDALTLGNLTEVQRLFGNSSEEAFRIASLEGHKEIVEWFLSKDVAIDSQNTQEQTALMLACAANRLEVVELLLGKKADHSLQDATGLTALMYASVVGSYKIANLLIDTGAEVNVYNSSEQAALTLAAAGGYWRIVRLLIDNGAELDKKDKTGRTALDWAIKHDHDNAIAELKKALEIIGKVVNL